MATTLIYQKYLELVLSEAQKSLEEYCTPVAACLVDRDSELIAVARSQAKSEETNRQGSIIHAELSLLLDNQPAFSKGHQITLYTSLEPCHMCMGAAIVSRVSTVVWATDDYWGGATRLYERWRDYLRMRTPELIRTPYPDLQRQGADLWVSHLIRVNKQEYIERILKWQTQIT